MNDWRHAATARLWLEEPVEGDAEALFAIHNDPASWWHFPSGRVTDQRVLGRGYAAEMGEAAITAAREVAPERPVLVFLDREPDDVLVAEVATEGWDADRFIR